MRRPESLSIVGAVMAEELHNPQDALLRAVLGDVAAATSFLQTHLPEEVRQALNWSTLKRLEGSVIDEDLRARCRR